MSKKEIITYKWNDELGNYCLAKGNDYIHPLEPMKLSKMNLDKMDLAETLQSIYYRKTGNIDYSIGLSYEKDITIAKKLGCWD